MSLLAPTPGEILDRLSILALKIPAFEKKELSAAHLEAEKAGLENRITDWDQGLREDYVDKITWDKIAEQKNALAAINALLWQAEDDARTTPKNESLKLARLLLHINYMNDARSRAIKNLNEIYGADAGQEKLYAHRSFVSDETLGVE